MKLHAKSCPICSEGEGKMVLKKITYSHLEKIQLQVHYRSARTCHGNEVVLEYDTYEELANLITFNVARVLKGDEAEKIIEDLIGYEMVEASNISDMVDILEKIAEYDEIEDKNEYRAIVKRFNKWKESLILIYFFMG